MALIAVAGVIATVLVVAGGDDDDQAAGDGEIFLQAVSEVGPDPFTASVAAPPPPSTVPAGTPITLGPSTGSDPPPTAPVFSSGPTPGAASGGALRVTARSGATPGLYGGTQDQSSCDVQAMIDFLVDNAAKARAWAEAQDLDVDDLARYLGALTPVLLRSDTRVTNHGFVDGRPNPLQSILQAGTAVLVDEFGLPRARCACGNPLLPPRAVPSTPSYQGQPWPGFNPGNVTVIDASTTVINVITIIEVGTGQPLGRSPGGGPDRPLPRTTTTTSVPTTSTTAGATGTFELVDVEETITELQSLWTVDARAGTARVALSAGDGNYSWTVPQRIDPTGTTIEWGGSSPPSANILVNIAPRSEGIQFSTADLAVEVTGSEGRKSALMTVPTALDEVKLIYSMGYSVTATYTYRR
ncbi:MAG: DUF6777 domain-containing protein [Acidimicrobiia bacterium]